MTASVETIDRGSAEPGELQRVAIAALTKALGTIGMVRFLQQLSPGHGDYTTERQAILGNPTVDELSEEIAWRRQ
jgi:hypothetical protein